MNDKISSIAIIIICATAAACFCYLLIEHFKSINVSVKMAEIRCSKFQNN